MCAWHVYICTVYLPGAYRDRKKGPDSLELELLMDRATMTVLGTTPGLSAKAALLLTTELSPAPTYLFQ